ncbi:MAG TPA: hypothetical protein VKU01_15145 [Bryobacteraceae bacterium]|nr:hypothetical protein [Bryobacteraceae bacterium]
MRILLRSVLSVQAVCLVTGVLLAANEPFLGKWKVNPSKSRLTDEMKVEVVGENKYAITFGPGAVDTIVADGTDQPAVQGTTLSVTEEGAKNWKVVRKKDGHRVVMGIWTLSADSKMLDDSFTAYGSDSSITNVHYTYQRTAGSSGFPGTWESVRAEVDASLELEIQPYGRDGISVSIPGLGLAQKVMFDGDGYPGSSPDAPPASAFSGRRVNQRCLELTSRFQTLQFEVSTDLKTLTMSIRQAGDDKPKNIFVFERE